MNILVSVASKHGSTAEIGSAIAATLREEGHDVEVLAPLAVRDVTRYDAVILGSGVYAGRWIGSAKEFAEKNAEALRARPVWLLSSGPLGETPTPTEDPADALKMVTLLNTAGASHVRRIPDEGGDGIRRAHDHQDGEGTVRRLPRLGRDQDLGARDRAGAEPTTDPAG